MAALSILLVHTGQASGAVDDSVYGPLVGHLDIGVTVFFLISGFLLYRPFVASRVLGARQIRVRDYARRRFLRVMPAYWLALTVLAIFPGLLGVFSGDWWVYYGLLQNYPVYTPSADCVTALYLFRCGIAPSWTLAVEIGFYVFLPIFAFLVGRAGARMRRRWVLPELLALLALTAASVVILSIDLSSGDTIVWLFYSPFGRGWWFALGMALAVASVRAEERGKPPAAIAWAAARPVTLWLAAGTLYAVACLTVFESVPLGAAFGTDQTAFVAQVMLFGAIAFLFLLPAVFSAERQSLPRRVLSNRALSWLGLISYGLFLWHYPIMLGLVDGDVLGWWPQQPFLVLASLTLAITVVCAALSYYLVERPLMRLK